MRLAPKHYWRRRLRLAKPEHFAAGLTCDAEVTIAMLSSQPQSALSWFDRFIAFLTTPFKFLGIDGWKETGCDARARGRPVRDAQHSTDGFWTIDVALETIVLGSAAADLTTRRYVRLEIEPETAAHAICAANFIGPPTFLEFGGAVVIDMDGPFLEIHPEADFHVGT